MISPKDKDRRFMVHYPRSAYTFPTEARVEALGFDDKFMSVVLEDGRVLHVPLTWIPSLLNASHEQRMGFTIGAGGYSLHWHPDDGSLNEDLLVESFMRYDKAHG